MSRFLSFILKVFFQLYPPTWPLGSMINHSNRIKFELSNFRMHVPKQVYKNFQFSFNKFSTTCTCRVTKGICQKNDEKRRIVLTFLVNTILGKIQKRAYYDICLLFASSLCWTIHNFDFIVVFFALLSFSFNFLARTIITTSCSYKGNNLKMDTNWHKHSQKNCVNNFILLLLILGKRQ